MAFSRTQMVAAVAGTLSLAVLTGCPAAPPNGTGPSAMASGSAAPSAAPSTAGSSTPASTTPSTATSSAPATGGSASPATGGSSSPSTSPSAGGSSAPTPAPSASAPAPSGEKVIVSGNVYDEEGATIDGALITVKSLDASVPYTATATTSQGSWVVNNVPEGANVEVIASKDGYTTRRRTSAFQKQATGKRNVINFGAAGGNADNEDDDALGEAYFISDYPEIASTEPATDATGVDNSKLTFKVRVSEALDEDSRDNLVEALTILPANEEAAGEDAGLDPTDFESREDSDASDGTHDPLEGSEDADDDTASEDVFDLTDGADRTNTLAFFDYTIEEGSTFLGNSDRDVTATWNAEGTELTFSFDATLIADKNDEAKYQAVLVSQGTGGDDVIEDEDGNQLGTNENGDLRNYPAEGEIIANAFKEVDLATKDTVVEADGAGNLDRAEANWASTHDSAVNWEIKRDETDPKLTGVDVSKDVDGDFRIELTFSEGMAAYNNTTAGESDLANLQDLEGNFRFTLGDKVGDTEDIDLGDDDTADAILLPTAADVNPQRAGVQTKFGEDDDLEDEFTFDNDAVDTAADSINDSDLTAGEIFVEVDDDNPNTVFIWIKDTPNFFDNKASEIKAYVEDVTDPAGNAISESDADKNQVRGTI